MLGSRQTPKQSLRPRTLSLADFDIIRQTGRGKFGQVYVARQKMTDFIVALKRMDRQELDQNRYCQQIKRQIIIQSSLNHPAILKLYGYFWDSSSVTLVLQYAPKGQLFDLIKKVNRLTQDKVAFVVKQICSGVEYLHNKHVIHRDLKPENILVSGNTVKIADFGWAVATQKRRNTFCGTLDYLSPQMLRGQQHDYKVDVWAIGILAYELATGKTPFEESSYSDTLARIVEENIVFPGYFSGELKKFIRRCLQKDPKLRPSAASLMNDPFLKKYADLEIDLYGDRSSSQGEYSS